MNMRYTIRGTDPFTFTDAEVKGLRSTYSSSSSTSFRRTSTFSNFVSFRRICDGFFTGNLVEVCDKNFCTLPGENFRDGFANAMSTASNDGNFILEPWPCPIKLRPTAALK